MKISTERLEELIAGWQQTADAPFPDGEDIDAHDVDFKDSCETTASALRELLSLRQRYEEAVGLLRECRHMTQSIGPGNIIIPSATTGAIDAFLAQERKP